MILCEHARHHRTSSHRIAHENAKKWDDETMKYRYKRAQVMTYSLPKYLRAPCSHPPAHHVHIIWCRAARPMIIIYFLLNILVVAPGKSTDIFAVGECRRSLSTAHSCIRYFRVPKCEIANCNRVKHVALIHLHAPQQATNDLWWMNFVSRMQRLQFSNVHRAMTCRPMIHMNFAVAHARLG